MTDRELFEFIDVEEMLRELGIRNVRNTHSGEIEFSCPFPGHSGLDSHPSASMSIVERDIPDKPGRTYPKTSYYCFTCGMRGTAISFLAEYEGVSPVAAKRFLKEKFAPGWVEPDVPITDIVKGILNDMDKETPAVRPVQTLDEKILERFAIDWKFVEASDDAPEYLQYMLDRGFTAETLTTFDVGYDEISSRITIPARNENGELVGFKARAWWPDAQPRYMSLKGDDYGFDSYESHRILWGLDRAREHLTGGYPLIVREGELNAMMMQQMGYSSTVGFSGNRLSRVQIDLIKKYSNDVLLWFDKMEDAYKASDLLMMSMQAAIAPETERDPADMTKEEVEETLLKAVDSIALRIR